MIGALTLISVCCAALSLVGSLILQLEGRQDRKAVKAQKATYICVAIAAVAAILSTL